MNKKQKNKKEELIKQLVEVAMSIALFDHDIDDNEIPEIKYHKEIFYNAFKKVIFQERKKDGRSTNKSQYQNGNCSH